MFTLKGWYLPGRSVPWQPGHLWPLNPVPCLELGQAAVSQEATPSEGSSTPSLFAIIVSPAAGEALAHSLAGSGVSVNQFETRRAAFPQREGCAGWEASSSPWSLPSRAEAQPPCGQTAVLLSPGVRPHPHLEGIQKCRFQGP